MRGIDLNTDLGEGGPHDAELIALVSSANIACGGHAGDETTMREAIEACLAKGAAIGAHPGYDDPARFGRRPLDIGVKAVEDLVSRQVERLAKLAALSGAEVRHVKPHGALYNQADRNPELAAAVAAGVAKILPGRGFYVPPSGALAAAGSAAGLAVRAEGFADRRYLANGGLVPRGQDGAVIDDIESAVAQALEIALGRKVFAISNTMIALPAETLCVHGDGPQAVELVGALRRALEAAGFTIRA